MSLRLYDTATRAVREFSPLRVGEASVYLCGVTVQSPPHVGHMRSAIAFDILQRWLTHTGHEVTFIRNVTDIDDKILVKADESGQPWWSLGYANERALSQAYQTFGVAAPTYEPRATGHIPEMHELIATLIDRGHAYARGADVYFDVPSFPAYGALSRQRADHIAPAEDGEPTAKKDPRDFALWKSHKPAEPESAAWPSPWGPGRPGWHIECSAMVWKYLGTAFDIHGGGLELIFPHHENEIAQSRAAGHDFAHLWMHNALVLLLGR